MFRYIDIRTTKGYFMKEFFTSPLRIFLIYIAFINLIAFLTFGIDKLKAKHHHYRISEKFLFTLCFIGGSLGGFLGMTIFHHKTLHKSFKYGVPTIFLAELFAFLFFLYKP